MSNLHGYWSGQGGAGRYTRVHIHIWSEATFLRGYIIARNLSGEVEIIDCIGKEESDTKAVFDLIDYTSDNPRSRPPQQAHFILNYQPEPKQVNAEFATDIGTHGVVRFRRASISGRLQLSFPASLHKPYRQVKRYISYKLRHFYLIFVIGLAVMSVFGRTPNKLTTVEAIVLLVPLFFMFSEQIRKVIETLALRKVGPIEFQDQARVPSGMTLEQRADILKSEFGEDVNLLSNLSQFFVPRTKSMLRLMVSYERPLTVSEFDDIARRIGVPENNLLATRCALVDSGCVASADGDMLTPQELSRTFLAFEEKLAELFRGTG